MSDTANTAGDTAAAQQAAQAVLDAQAATEADKLNAPPTVATGDPTPPPPAAVPEPPARELAIGQLVSHTFGDVTSDAGVVKRRGMVIDITHPVGKGVDGLDTVLTHYVVGWFDSASDAIPAEVLDP